MGPDFSGFVTKNNLRCADGRTILSGAFKHNDGMKVPLVWRHMHNSVDNVLGYVKLENRPEGVYGYGYFNKTKAGETARTLVEHEDIKSMSIYANQLTQDEAKNVSHGFIREVSLVLSGANPGALIDTVNLSHSDGSYTEIEDEAVIYSGEDSSISVEHESKEEKMADTTDKLDEKTVQDVVDSMNEEQKNVLYFLVGKALEDEDGEDDEKDATKHSDSSIESVLNSMTERQYNTLITLVEDAIKHSEENEDAIQHNQEGLQDMSRNVFEDEEKEPNTLSHTDISSIFSDAKIGGSLKESVDKYALTHGIDNIEILFPDAQAVNNTPEFLKRRTEWVNSVMTNTHHTPFSRIKTFSADITVEEARAKGYVKGSLKKEEFFRVSKRVTTPQTVYKKQKLDRDDIVDITSFDIVSWLKGEMRIMLEEEIARAILIGDGRSFEDEDKINEEHIRPIATDNELYATTIYVKVDLSDPDAAEAIVDAVTLQRHHYRGSGTPTFYCSESILGKLLTAKDKVGRRLYPTIAEAAAALRVTAIVPVEVMEGQGSLLGIMVDLRDYSVGATAGGEVTMFDDFDIDFNQQKYLIETRISGALTRFKSALVIRKVAGSDVLVVPVAPTKTGNIVSIPAVTGVTYFVNDETGTPITVTDGTLTLTSDYGVVTVMAKPDDGYYFATNVDDEWMFEHSA